VAESALSFCTGREISADGRVREKTLQQVHARSGHLARVTKKHDVAAPCLSGRKRCRHNASTNQVNTHQCIKQTHPHTTIMPSWRHGDDCTFSLCTARGKSTVIAVPSAQLLPALRYPSRSNLHGDCAQNSARKCRTNESHTGYIYMSHTDVQTGWVCVETCEQALGSCGRGGLYHDCAIFCLYLNKHQQLARLWRTCTGGCKKGSWRAARERGASYHTFQHEPKYTENAALALEENFQI
jgi:hypothetical protein